MLPVLEHNGWQVETVLVDLGTGLREWIEIRRGTDRVYCATETERDAVLRDHGLDLRQFASVDTIDIGCE